jgi:nucleolar GTP-binding protein
VLVLNKIDVKRLEDLAPETRALVDEIIAAADVKCVQISCYSEEGVMELKNKACDALLEHRVDAKLRGTKVDAIANRIHVAQPKPRDEIVREPCIPDAVKNRRKYDKSDPERRRLERDVEAEEGGAGVYNINMKSKFPPFEDDMKVGFADREFAENYMLRNPEWNMDIMPEIMDGKNVADFIDPDIEEKLEALEREEERLQAEGFYDSESDMVRPYHLLLIVEAGHVTAVQWNSDDEREAAEAHDNLEKKMASQSLKKGMKHAARLPRTAGLRTLSDMSAALTRAGLDPSRIEEKAMVIAKARGAERKRKREEREDGMDVDDDEIGGAGEGEDGWMDVDGEGEGTPAKRARGNAGDVVAKARREPKSNRQLAGMRDQTVSLGTILSREFVRSRDFGVLQQADKAVRLRNLGQRERNRMAKAGESDRAIKTKMVRVSAPRCYTVTYDNDGNVVPVAAQAFIRREAENGEDEQTITCFPSCPCIVVPRLLYQSAACVRGFLSMLARYKSFCLCKALQG